MEGSRNESRYGRGQKFESIGVGSRRGVVGPNDHPRIDK